jgi:hypothetical protein
MPILQSELHLDVSQIKLPLLTAHIVTQLYEYKSVSMEARLWKMYIEICGVLFIHQPRTTLGGERDKEIYRDSYSTTGFRD